MTISQAIDFHETALAAVADARWVDAQEAATCALAVFETEDGPDSPDVANLSNLLSSIAVSRTQYSLAEQHARRAWDIMERLGSRCSGPDADAIRIEALGGLGTAVRSAGRYDEAEPWLRRAVDLAEVGQAVSPAVVAGALNNLGVLYKYSGNFDESEHLYQRALRLVPENSTLAATLYHNLGGLAHSRGRYVEAEAPGRRAWEIRAVLMGRDHPDTLADACAYAAILDGLDRYDESEPIYRHALAVFQRCLGPEHLEIAVTLSNLAAVVRYRGNAQEAEELYRRALEMKRRLFGETHPDTALTACNYAALLCDLDRRAEARDLCAYALATFEQTLDPQHPRIAAAREIWNRCAANS
jgi:tetratricopeptide (TPR) repeat protein